MMPSSYSTMLRSNRLLVSPQIWQHLLPVIPTLLSTLDDYHLPKSFPSSKNLRYELVSVAFTPNVTSVFLFSFLLHMHYSLALVTWYLAWRLGCIMTLSPFLGQMFSRKGYVLVLSPALFRDPSQQFPYSRLSKYILKNLVILGHMVLRAVVLCEMGDS